MGHNWITGGTQLCAVQETRGGESNPNPRQRETGDRGPEAVEQHLEDIVQQVTECQGYVSLRWDEVSDELQSNILSQAVSYCLRLSLDLLI